MDHGGVAAYSFTARRRATYLRALEEGMTRTAAAAAAGVPLRTVQRHAQRDPELRAAVEEAEDCAVVMVEDALFTTAQRGNVRAQELFLVNRAPGRWRRAGDAEAAAAGAATGLVRALVASVKAEPPEEDGTPREDSA